MNSRSTRLILLALASLAPAAGAAVVVYDHDTSADPTTQGWTQQKSATNNFLGGFDAGNGWRVVDATTTGSVFYEHALTDMDAIDAAGGWSVSWISSMDSDAYHVGTQAVGVDNYFLPPNQSRQGNSGIWVGNAGSYLYWLTFGADAAGNLTLSDGTTTHAITGGGSNSGYDVFKSFVLTYDGAGTATLTVDSQSFNIAARAAAGGDRVIFGSATSAGQGSAVFSNITFVPEPSAALLGALGMLALLRRRRA